MSAVNRVNAPLPSLAILYEHPDWQKPLFQALERRGILYDAIDLKKNAFAVGRAPTATLYFNQASPSAYVRGNTRAVPYALSFMRSLEIAGARVLNGSRAFALELSKTAQAAMLGKLGIDHPASVTFNDVRAAVDQWENGQRWPALLKPEQGGSGARMFLVNSAAELERLLTEQPNLWEPDHLLLLQEYFPVDPSRGIVRMEFVGGEFLYAMRVVSHGGFNLCPSEVCHPTAGDGACEVPLTPEKKPTKPVEFYAYKDVPAEAVRAGKRIMQEGGLDIGGIEYLEAQDGRLIFYDINANSNLRAPIALEFGFDPFERVVDFLARELAAQTQAI